MLFLGIIKNLNYLHVNSIAIFIVNFIAIIPLAIMISYATKEITRRAGNTLGGLLNATFRNAVELIITIVKTFLIGSMLSNLLLILSICFFFKVVNTTASLLALYVSSLIILTAFYSMLLSKFNNSFRPIIDTNLPVILLIIYGAIITLRFSTALVAFYSEFIVNSISNITASGTVSTTFVGLILLPIIGNAAKYVIAVIVAFKDKISLVINDYIMLYFNTFLIAVLFVTILLVNYLI
ncbi:hypothetical protein V2W45_1471700 [Cenococcum geophilum]